MPMCLIIDNDNNAKFSSDSVNTCEGYVLPSAIEYKSFINPSLDIQTELFDLVVVSLLVTFIVGHVTGRIVRYLGKK